MGVPLAGRRSPRAFLFLRWGKCDSGGVMNRHETDDKTFYAVLVMGVMVSILLLWMGLKGHTPESPPDQKTYERMLQRASDLSLSAGLMTVEQHCEYEELCRRIGVYRADRVENR